MKRNKLLRCIRAYGWSRVAKDLVFRPLLQAIPANSVVRHTTEGNSNSIADISRAIGISREERVILLHETLKKSLQTNGAVTNSVI